MQVKRRMIAVLILSCALLFPYALARADDLMDEQMIRLHVIANSDAAADQAVKLMARDAVRQVVNEKLAGVKDSAEAYRLLHLAMGDIKTAAESALTEQGYFYGAKVEMGIFDFPDRQYSDVLVPAGKYRAVRVVLGAGEGKNWWCVLYPDLCYVNEACQKTASEGGEIRLRSSLFDAITRWLKER